VLVMCRGNTPDLQCMCSFVPKLWIQIIHVNGEGYVNRIFTLLLVIVHFRMSIVRLRGLYFRPSDLKNQSTSNT